MENNCPVCNKINFKFMGVPKVNSLSSGFIKTTYQVVQCKNCGLYYVAPAISFTPEQWQALYNSEYFASQTEWLYNQRKKELLGRFTKAEQLLNKKENINFLDVGCGEGNALAEAAKRNWNATGIDITDNRNENAKTENINFKTGSLLEQNFPADTFDFVYMDSVLEHTLQPLEYLTEIKRILKKNGIVYVGIPNEDCLFNTIRKIVFTLTGKGNISVKIKPFDTPYHVVGFNKSSLQFIVNKAGLTLAELENVGRKMDFLSFKITSKGFWISFIFLFPIEIFGMLLKKDVYYSAYLTK
ncbi:MAG: class I SAM-dependent methyltransferase [Ignavibacteriales bacterium]|nr:MAG: class I SAM-dependent methyltransferase [Ignavibacteriales bacterium]